MPDQTPEDFGGRYEITNKIARGGMAEVYCARDQLLDRPVALKVLFPELSTDPAFVERFRREAQAAANLSHPNVVSVYDWGEEGSTYFIVMEFVSGKTLSQLLREEGPLLPDRAADIGASVAAALSFAHSNGVIHRDVKPGNVLIDDHGHVKVTDFGIARARNTSEHLTQTGAVMGTATYFSPEQAQGVAVDPRSDVYSLGVVLYEMVCGVPPFTGDNPVAIASKHVREEPAPPRSRNARVPVDFESIVMKAMAKNPADRYASADELRADLVRFRQGRAIAAPAVTVGATQAVPATAVQGRYLADGGTAAIPASAAAGPPPEERRTGAYVILLFVMLAALGVLIWLMGRELGLWGAGADAEVTVPSVVLKPLDEATALLEDSGFAVDIEYVDSDQAENIVLEQDPAANSKAKRGSTVKLVVSKPEETVEIPDVEGESFEEAKRILEEAGFTVERKDEPNNEVRAGRVIGTTPDSGEKAPRGSKVIVEVSTGSEKVAVPNVRGRTETAARDALEKAGLQPDATVVEEFSDDMQEGLVTRTDPAAGSQVDEGDTVTIYVSKGPRPTTTSSSTSSTTSTTA